GVAVDSAGHVFVADRYLSSTIRKIDLASGAVTTAAGKAGAFGHQDGVGNAARFWLPAGVAFGGSGGVYGADPNKDGVRRIDGMTGAVTTLAGMPTMQGSTDGATGDARFFGPMGLVSDGKDTLYVTDLFNATVRRIIVSTGAVTTLAGTPMQQGSADGTG